ncbi:VOC family protein [Kineosporia babensis]|uniref:VOC family protein n=1 Tax=Kineosporia babensis TaxID=499548 RepID=A0A9X1NHY3_9ACTN|nr:VOC family protein [Kineosporia babensis]MCD5315377.1 VOC family protein [Kineosporia babensis]
MPTVQPILLTPDAERLAAFYIQVFGAKQTSREPAEGAVFYIGLQIGDSELGIVAETAIEPHSPTRALLSIEVADADATAVKVEAAGGKVMGPANDMPWGQRVAHTQDPDGTPVNLTQNLLK